MSKPDMKITIGMFNSRGRFYRQASRSGYDVHVAGATTGVKVMPRVHPDDGTVTYELWETCGRHKTRHDRLVGKIKDGQLFRIDPKTHEVIS